MNEILSSKPEEKKEDEKKEDKKEMKKFLTDSVLKTKKSNMTEDRKERMSKRLNMAKNEQCQ